MSKANGVRRNTAATVSATSAAVGAFILPIIFGPMAIIFGFVGLRNHEEGSNIAVAAVVGIVAGFAEIIYILVQWHAAGLVS